MRRISVAAFAVAFQLSLPALGDIPPPDACQTEGSACQNGPPDFKGSGVCTKSTCSRFVPGMDAAQSFSCLKCQPGDTSPTDAGTPSSDSGDGGCRVASTPASGFGACLLCAALLGLCLRRRS